MAADQRLWTRCGCRGLPENLRRSAEDRFYFTSLSAFPSTRDWTSLPTAARRAGQVFSRRPPERGGGAAWSDPLDGPLRGGPSPWMTSGRSSWPTCEARNLSPRALEWYADRIRRFTDWCVDREITGAFRPSVVGSSGLRPGSPAAGLRRQHCARLRPGGEDALPAGSPDDAEADWWVRVPSGARLLRFANLLGGHKFSFPIRPRRPSEHLTPT